jgi:phage shock protein C
MSQKLYRSRNGMIFGVCRGLSDYFDLSLAWIRIGFVVAFAFTLFFPTGLIYLCLALLLKKQPLPTEAIRSSSASYQPQANARTVHLRQLKKKFESLDSRIRRMETHVTDKAYDWEARLNAK